MRDASLRADNIARGVGLGSLALILGALGFQYIGGVVPCEMCHWQRWPHIAAALAGLVLIPLGKNMRLAVTALAVICGLIAGYHWGMLAGWQPQLLAAVIIALLAAALWNNNTQALAWAAMALVLASGLIGLYQSGMQWGILPGPSSCSGHRFVIGSNMTPDVQCDVVTWQLFGLSLAAYNAIFSFLIAGLGGFALLKAKNAP